MIATRSIQESPDDARCGLAEITPFAILVKGASAAAQHQMLNTVLAQHLQDAATEQAQAIFELSHRLAKLWLEPEPLGPMATVTKVAQTQMLLLQHLSETAQCGADRFSEIVEIDRSLEA